MLERKWPLILLAIILTFLLFYGSLEDYKISEALYIGDKPSENFLGILFAFIGIIPTFVGWGFLGAGILALTKKDSTHIKKRRGLITFSIILLALSFCFFCNTLQFVNAGSFPVHPVIAYTVGTIVILAAALLGYSLSKKSKDPELLDKILVLATISLAVMVVVMSTKEIMCRPRFRFVMETSNMDYFINWWQSGRDIKAGLSTGTAGDNFTSFPSGHSAYGMFAVILFPALAEFIPKLQKIRPLLFVLGVVWWGVTAFSRITVGAHYLSDVVFSGLITIASYWIVILIKNRRRKRLD